MSDNLLINLESLIDLSAKLNEAPDKNYIYNIILLSIMGKLKATRGAVFEKKNNKYHSVIKKGSINFDDFNFKLNEDILKNELMASNKISNYFLINNLDKNSPLILIGNKFNDLELTKSETTYINIVLKIVSIALQNLYSLEELKIEKQNINKKNQLLETLFTLSKDYAGILTNTKIIKMLGYSLMGQLLINKFAIALVNNKEIKIKENRLDISEDELKEIINEQIATNKYLIISMKVSGKTKGWLILGNKLNNLHLSDDELQFAESLGNTAITALENQRLIKDEIERRQLEKELNLALEIQLNLLPKQNLITEKFSILGKSIASRFVGGDYYDFIQISKSEVFILIADVSGKGISAAMIMANLQSALRILVPMNLDLNLLFNNLNKLVFNNTSVDRFVTFFGGILNTENGKFQYINAGHNPPILIKNNNIEYLKTGGLIFGLLDSFIEYDVAEITLEKEDLLFLYTDGISESINTNDEEFDESRLSEFLLEKKSKGNNYIYDNIKNEVDSFTGNNSLYDDFTFITIQRINQ